MWSTSTDAIVKINDYAWVRRSSVAAVTRTGDKTHVSLQSGEFFSLDAAEHSVKSVIDTIFGAAQSG